MRTHAVGPVLSASYVARRCSATGVSTRKGGNANHQSCLQGTTTLCVIQSLFYSIGLSDIVYRINRRNEKGGEEDRMEISAIMVCSVSHLPATGQRLPNGHVGTWPDCRMHRTSFLRKSISGVLCFWVPVALRPDIRPDRPANTIGASCLAVPNSPDIPIALRLDRELQVSRVLAAAGFDPCIPLGRRRDPEYTQRPVRTGGSGRHGNTASYGCGRGRFCLVRWPPAPLFSSQGVWRRSAGSYEASRIAEVCGTPPVSLRIRSSSAFRSQL